MQRLRYREIARYIDREGEYAFDEVVMKIRKDEEFNVLEKMLGEMRRNEWTEYKNLEELNKKGLSKEDQKKLEELDAKGLSQEEQQKLEQAAAEIDQR